MNSKSKIYSRYFTHIKPLGKLPIIKTYGSTIFTLIVITVFIFFAIKPTVETILILQKKLSDMTEVLDKINKKAEDLSLGKQNYDNLDPNIKDKISSSVPSSVDIKSITQSLEQAAQTYEASISALQIQPLVIKTKTEGVVGKLEEINFTFNVEGSYQNLISLLQDLRGSSRLISIDTVSLSKVTEGSGLIMSIIGKAYYIK